MTFAAYFGKKRWWIIAGVVTIVIVVVVGYWYYRGYDPDSITLDQNDPRVVAERERFQGNWYSPGGHFYVTVRGNTWVSYVWSLHFEDDTSHVTWEENTLAFGLDPTANPKRIDLIGKTFFLSHVERKGVYEIEGDTFTLYFRRDRQPPPPTSISTDYNICEVVIFKKLSGELEFFDHL